MTHRSLTKIKFRQELTTKAGGVFGDKGFVATDTSPPLSASQNAVSYCNGNTSGTIRRPLKTFKSSFRAATGLYFYKKRFA